MSNISITREQNTVVTRVGSGDCDRDDNLTTHQISGFDVVDKLGIDFTVSFTPEVGKDYFLLYIIYDTGDSYGRDAGMISLLDLYQTHAAAEADAKAIRLHHTKYENNDLDNKNQFSVTLNGENGEVRRIHTEWLGYFERLESINVIPHQLNRITKY